MNPPDAAFCLNCASPLSHAAFGGGQAQGGYNMQHNAAGASQKGMIALILAIAAFLCCGPFTGVPAAIVGWMELDAIKSGRAPGDNRWMALAGLWGGIAATVIHIGGYVIWMLMGMLSAASGPYYY